MQEQQDSGAASGGSGTSLARDLALYSAIRLAMLAAGAGLLTWLGVPLLVALAVSIIVVFVLSLLAFGGVRRRVEAGLAQHSARRQQQRERLRAQLRGERNAEAD